MKFVTLAALILFSGCAYGDRTVMLKYPPENPGSGLGVPAAEAATIADFTLILAPFEDRRVEGKLIGEVLNGYGTRTADVLVGNDVGGWVTDALRKELEKAGYKVKPTKGGASSPNEVLLTGEVGRVFCTAYLTYEGDVGFEVRVEWDGKEVFTKRYLGHARSGLNWAMTAKSSGNILALALQDAARKFVRDLNEAFVGDEPMATKKTEEPAKKEDTETVEESTKAKEEVSEEGVGKVAEEDALVRPREIPKGARVV